MRIISKFKDYYDSVQMYGIDKSYIYKRDEEYIKKDHPAYNTILKFAGGVKKHLYVSCYRRGAFGVYELGIVLFCGKVIPYVILEYQVKDKYTLETKHQIVYSMKDVDEVVKKTLDKKAQIEFNKNNRYFLGYSYVSRRDMLSVFEHSFKEYSAITDILSDTKCPIILISYKDSNHKPVITKNPVLKDIEFYRVMDSYTTFQELVRYIDGILGKPAVETIEISDEVRRDKHGFDKWSFKKMPKEE